MNIFFEDANYLDSKEIDNDDLTLIFKRFGISSNMSKTNMTGPYISQGVFMIKSLIYSSNVHNTNLYPNVVDNFYSEITKFPEQALLHFSSSNLSHLTTQVGDEIDMDTSAPGWPTGGDYTVELDEHKLPYYYYNRGFTTSIRRLYPYVNDETPISDSNNIVAMYFANKFKPHSVGCSINSYTKDYEHDLWSHNSNGDVRNLPAITECRDLDDNDNKVSHIQQAQFTVNMLRTDINIAGTEAWAKQKVVFTEGVKDNTLPVGSEYDQYLYNVDHGADQNNYHCDAPSTAPIMLDLILKNGLYDVFDGGEGVPQYNMCDFTFGVCLANTNINRNLPYLDPYVDGDPTVSNLTQSPFFRIAGIEEYASGNPSHSIETWDVETYYKAQLENAADYIPGDYNYAYKDPQMLMVAPVLFSLLTNDNDSYFYGYNDVYRSEGTSANTMFAIATAASTNFALLNNKYSNFVIYKTGSGNNYQISYAIDLRGLSTVGGAAKAGKTLVNVSTNTTDVLAIAYKNIYILSASQVADYIHQFVQ